MDFAELEHSTDRALRRLPMPAAPQTLLPRVLAAVARLARRPWYSRTWFTWPAPLRVGSAIAGVILMALTVVFAPQTAQVGAASSHYLSVAIAALPELLDLASRIAAVVQITWQGVLQPVAVFGFAIIVLSVLICGGCWRIVNRLTLTSESA